MGTTASVLAQAVSAEIRALNAVTGISGRRLHELSRVGQSHNYLAERLRGDKPFSLDEVDRIAAVFGLDGAALIQQAVDKWIDPDSGALVPMAERQARAVEARRADAG